MASLSPVVSVSSDMAEQMGRTRGTNAVPQSYSNTGSRYTGNTCMCIIKDTLIITLFVFLPKENKLTEAYINWTWCEQLHRLFNNSTLKNNFKFGQ